MTEDLPVPHHQRRRDETGQTIVEFIGGFIVLCAVITACLTLVDPVRETARDLCAQALDVMRDGPG